MTMLASIPAPPITELHPGPLRVTLFGIVVAFALLAGIRDVRRYAEMFMPAEQLLTDLGIAAAP